MPKRALVTLVRPGGYRGVHLPRITLEPVDKQCTRLHGPLDMRRLTAPEHDSVEPVDEVVWKEGRRRARRGRWPGAAPPRRRPAPERRVAPLHAQKRPPQRLLSAPRTRTCLHDTPLRSNSFCRSERIFGRQASMSEPSVTRLVSVRPVVSAIQRELDVIAARRTLHRTASATAELPQRRVLEVSPSAPAAPVLGSRTTPAAAAGDLQPLGSAHSSPRHVERASLCGSISSLPSAPSVASHSLPSQGTRHVKSFDRIDVLTSSPPPPDSVEVKCSCAIM